MEHGRFGRTARLVLVTLALGARPAAAADCWWTSGYAYDYGLLAASAAATLGVHGASPRGEALIGPVHRFDDPAATLDPAHADRIGRTYLEEGSGETVPESWVATAIPVTLAWLAAEDLLVRRNEGDADWHGLHDTTVGLSEAVLATLALTEVLKVAVGRLRPDFQGRLRRHGCATGQLGPAHCGDDVGPPLAEDTGEAEALLEDGRKSFPSGHSSISFALATYGALTVGGHWVWGRRATPTSRTLGIAVQTLALAAAAVVATSRVDDGRHHLGDVATGAALGAGLANAFYWRHFDASGEPRTHGGESAVGLSGGPGDVGIAVVVAY